MLSNTVCVNNIQIQQNDLPTVHPTTIIGETKVPPTLYFISLRVKPTAPMDPTVMIIIRNSRTISVS